LDLFKQNNNNHLLLQAMDYLIKCKEIACKSDSHLKSILILTEFEIFIKSGDWDKAEYLINDLIEQDAHLSSKLFERLTEIALNEPNIPCNILSLLFQITLDSLLGEKGSKLKKSDEKVDWMKFSQWFRCMIIATVASDKSRALKFYYQIVELFKSDKNIEYPNSEIEWLLIKAWNSGVELLNLGIRDDGKEWLELSISLLNFLSNSHVYKSMQEMYTEMIAKF
jgi:hypothetical protein